MELNEQVAYFRGLLEGQEFGDEKEMVLWEQVLNLFDSISTEIKDLQDQDEDLEEYVEAIDEDLGYLEESYYPPDTEESEETNSYARARTSACASAGVEAEDEGEINS